MRTGHLSVRAPSKNLNETMHAHVIAKLMIARADGS